MNWIQNLVRSFMEVLKILCDMCPWDKADYVIM